jgi:hypothetical protein
MKDEETEVLTTANKRSVSSNDGSHLQPALSNEHVPGLRATPVVVMPSPAGSLSI